MSKIFCIIILNALINLTFTNINSIDDHFNSLSHIVGKDTQRARKCGESIISSQFRNHLALYHRSTNNYCLPPVYQVELKRFNDMLMNASPCDFNNLTLSYRFQM